MGCFIEEYYYNIENISFKKTDFALKYTKEIESLNEIEAAIFEKLEDVNKDLLSRYIEINTNLLALCEKESYIKGFRKGAQFMLDILESE